MVEQFQKLDSIFKQGARPSFYTKTPFKFLFSIILFGLSLQLSTSFLTVQQSQQTSISLFFAFGGVALAILTIFDLRYSFAILIGFILYLITQPGNLHNLSLPLFFVVTILTITYTLEAWVLRRILKLNQNFREPDDVIKLIVASLILPNLLFISIYPLFHSVIKLHLLVYQITIFWIEDLIGILTFYPILLFFSTTNFSNLKFTISKIYPFSKLRKTTIEKTLILISIPIVQLLIIWIQEYFETEIFYLSYLPVLWLSSKYDFRVTSMGIFITNVFYLVFIKGYNLNLDILQFQTFMLIFSSVSLIFSVLISNRNLHLQESMTSLERSNEELDRINQEFKRSNRELEQFAYVASHDLQEPLRAIISYLQLLVKRIGDSMDTKSQKYINGVIDASKRMEGMINDLLTYSRVGTHNQNIEKVDLNTTIEIVKENLQKQIQSSNAIIKTTPLPLVLANNVQMIQLFQNLISNSIKYCHKKPEVIISSKIEGEYAVISIRDNGIGIDSEYFEKIFIIFQRLHNKSEYSGTGIGLAICKKIVENHGGKINVASKTGEGSTFKFNLPYIGEQ